MIICKEGEPLPKSLQRNRVVETQQYTPEDLSLYYINLVDIFTQARRLKLSLKGRLATRIGHLNVTEGMGILDQQVSVDGYRRLIYPVFEIMGEGVEIPSVFRAVILPPILKPTYGRNEQPSQTLEPVIDRYAIPPLSFSIGDYIGRSIDFTQDRNITSQTGIRGKVGLRREAFMPTGELTDIPFLNQNKFPLSARLEQV